MRAVFAGWVCRAAAGEAAAAPCRARRRGCSRVPGAEPSPREAPGRGRASVTPVPCPQRGGRQRGQRGAACPRALRRDVWRVKPQPAGSCRGSQTARGAPSAGVAAGESPSSGFWRRNLLKTFLCLKAHADFWAPRPRRLQIRFEIIPQDLGKLCSRCCVPSRARRSRLAILDDGCPLAVLAEHPQASCGC